MDLYLDKLILLSGNTPHSMLGALNIISKWLLEVLSRRGTWPDPCFLESRLAAGWRRGCRGGWMDAGTRWRGLHSSWWAMGDLTSGLWWTPGWPAKAMEMTKPGPCPQATEEVPGHSSSPQTRLQDHVLCKHLLCARPLPWATIPHFSFFVWVRRIPEWGLGELLSFLWGAFLD